MIQIKKKQETILKKFINKKDLEWYEGPILSVMEDTKGDSYLFWWVDQDSSHNRWLIFKTTKVLVEEYENGNIRMLDFFIKPNKYFICDISNFVPEFLTLYELEELPKEYLPNV